MIRVHYVFLEITNRPRVIFGGNGIASLAIVVVNTCIGGDNINNCWIRSRPSQKPHMDGMGGIRSKVMEKGTFASQG
jgi:hypothetical protein